MTAAGGTSMPGAVSITEAAEAYVPALVFGRSDSLLRLLGTNAIIEDPRAGHVEGAHAVVRFARDLQRCLEPWMPRLQHLRTTVTRRRACSEDILRLDLDGEAVELPVATVVSRDESRGRFAVRAYHTLRPFNCPGAGCATRPSTSASRGESPVDSDVVTEYLDRLRAGDLNAALACLEADIYLRQAGGPGDIHCGTSAVRAYLSRLDRETMPLMQAERTTDDGRCAAIEFSFAGAAGQAGDHQESAPCLAVFERSEDRRIRAIRIYANAALDPHEP